MNQKKIIVKILIRGVRMQEQKYIKIKDKNIPIIIRNYKTSKYLKLYFKANILYVSKPKYISMKKTMDFILDEECHPDNYNCSSRGFSGSPR